jgi:hypothetical protein
MKKGAEAPLHELPKIGPRVARTCICCLAQWRRSQASSTSDWYLSRRASEVHSNSTAHEIWGLSVSRPDRVFGAETGIAGIRAALKAAQRKSADNRAGHEPIDLSFMYTLQIPESLPISFLSR